MDITVSIGIDVQMKRLCGGTRSSLLSQFGSKQVLETATFSEQLGLLCLCRTRKNATKNGFVLLAPASEAGSKEFCCTFGFLGGPEHQNRASHADVVASLLSCMDCRLVYQHR